jgi:2-amino-4-hydroxy-6-hydroxymethyldihydropteridine diphosphokinase
MTDGWTPCVVALGSNLGDREDLAQRALADIRATEGFVIRAASSVRETLALGVDGVDLEAPRYLNQVILLDSAWSPERTLGLLLSIEEAHGRVRGDQGDTKRYANRTLDLDLITYGDRVVQSASLSLPHPRAHERRFVLEPWNEVDPKAVLPGRGPVATLLGGLAPDAP